MKFTPFFSGSIKKVLSVTGFLVLSTALIYSLSLREGAPLLSGNLLNALPPESIVSLPISDPDKVKVWLSAGQGITTNAQGKVTQWEDLSGNGNHVVAHPDHAPELVQDNEQGVFNFHPVISFNGQNTFLRSLSQGGYGDQFFIVFRSVGNSISSNSPNPGQTVFGLNDPNNLDQMTGLSLGPIVPDGYNNYPNGEVITFASGAYRAGTFSQNYNYPQTPLLVQVKNSPNLETSMFLNGSEDVINGTSQGQPSNLINTVFTLGRDTAGNHSFKGEIAELIVLKDGLDEVETQRIQEYLGSKYGISIGLKNDYSLDPKNEILFKVEQNIKYAFSIFGIGRYDAIGLNIGAQGSQNPFSRSTHRGDRMLSIGQASDLDNGEFVYIARNIESNTWSNSYTQEGAQLLNRKWRLQQSAIDLGEEPDESGVGSVVMAVKIEGGLKLPNPPLNKTYALAFFENEDFNGPAKKYVILNDEGKDGDALAGDNQYSGTVDDLKGLHYFTLVQFAVLPPALKIDSVQQLPENLKKVLIQTTIKDLNKEENIQLRVEFDNGGGQCNGPWVSAALSTPLTSSQGSAVLLSPQQQDQKQGFQIENIQTQDSPQNQVSFIWNAGVDLPQAFNQVGVSNHCLRLFVRDQMIQGTMENTMVTLEYDGKEEQLPEEEELVEEKEELPEEEELVEEEEELPEEEEEELVEEEELGGIKATIAIKVLGLKDSGIATVDISNGVVSGVKVASGSEVDFEVKAQLPYKITCQEDIPGHFLLNVENPTLIDEGALMEGMKAIVSCEYAEGDVNEGTLVYTQELAQNIFQTETACLDYDPKIRELQFTDVQDLNIIGAKAALILKNTYLLGGTPGEALAELKNQFPLSGQNSLIGDAGQLEAQVDLKGIVTRADAFKVVLTTFCIPIFNEASLAGETLRIDGRPMPHYIDTPRKGTVASNIVATVSKLGIAEGTNYEGKHAPNQPNRIHWNAPITKAEAIKIILNAKQLWQGYQDNSDYDKAKELGFNEKDWFFPFYAKVLKFNSGSVVQKSPGILQEVESYATRGEIIDYIFQTLLNGGLYKDEAAVREAYEAFGQEQEKSI